MVGNAAPQTSAVATIAAAGAPACAEHDQRHQPAGVDHRLHEHHARPEPVDQPAAERRAEAGAERERARRGAGQAERAGLRPQQQHERERR